MLGPGGCLRPVSARPTTMAFAAGEDSGTTGILQYDYLPIYADDQYEKVSEQPVSAANVFTADRDMEITGVSARPSRGTRMNSRGSGNS